jgi:tRNA nucleotidyltransferase/poly(A) polymerase
MREPDPEKQRWFAVEVVRQLRAQNHESYWAGGCVRDQLLGRPPKDYDVATSARHKSARCSASAARSPLGRPLA